MPDEKRTNPFAASRFKSLQHVAYLMVLTSFSVYDRSVHRVLSVDFDVPCPVTWLPLPGHVTLLDNNPLPRLQKREISRVGFYKRVSNGPPIK